MKNNASIAIAIPVLNEEKNIKRCLDSIKNQSYKGKIEVFVVDNGCTDKTIEIAKKYKFVKVIRNTVNDYLIAKMLVLKKTNSKYYTYLDADIDLPTKFWVSKMIEPLEEDARVDASFTGFVSYDSDPSLNKYLTLDTIQRDPLFVYLTTSIESTVIEKRKKYDLCEFSKNKIVPMGLCVFRRKELLSIKEIAKNNKFHELNNLVLMVNNKYVKFAYVEDAGLHHLTVPNLKVMISKRVRNLRKTFFVKGEKRYWNWIDTTNKKSLLKLLIWILYAETFILPFVYGIYRSIKNRTWLGLYEPVVVWLTTNSILYVFITSEGGRKFVTNILTG